MATTRAQQMEMEHQRQEQGERFMNQLAEMFKAQRQDMSLQYVPRPEFSAHMEKMDQVLEGLEKTVERIGGNVSTFHDNAPVRFADKSEMKDVLGELRTEIEKLKTARESDMQRGYGARFEDMQRGYGSRFEDIQGRYKGDAAVERGWRTSAQQSSQLALGWVIGGGFVLLAAILALVLHR